MKSSACSSPADWLGSAVDESESVRGVSPRSRAERQPGAEGVSRADRGAPARHRSSIRISPPRTPISAIAYSLGLARGLMTDKDANERAEWYARQAVRLDPNLAAAHLALGRAFVRSSGSFPRSDAREPRGASPDAERPQALYTVVGYFVSTGDLQQCAMRRRSSDATRSVVVRGEDARLLVRECRRCRRGAEERAVRAGVERDGAGRTRHARDRASPPGQSGRSRGRGGRR